MLKDKFSDQRLITPLTAKNERQKEALREFTKKQLVVLSGSAGSGKTEIMCWWASKQWLTGGVDNIVICRPHEPLGRDYGAVPGRDDEKLIPFCMSMLLKLKKYLGVNILKNNFRACPSESLFQEVSGISIVPIEKIQGMSFNSRTILLCDEQQNSTQAQMKALVTRAEEGCQIIIAGDPMQSALKGDNGLTMLERALQRHPHEDATVVKFTPQDNCRSGVSGHLANVFENEGGW